MSAQELDRAATPLRTVLAEGTFLVRDALVRLLGGAPEIELVAVCEDVSRLPAAVEEHLPDVVITDLGSPWRIDAHGVHVVGELLRAHPELAVVILTSHSDASDAISLLAFGTDRRAYLLKERVHSRRQLLSIIESVVRGGSIVDAKVVESFTGGTVPRDDRRLAALSGRGRDILERMAHGASNGAIAASLGLTKRAVEKHVNAIFSKLDIPLADDVSRRVQAVLIYLAASGEQAAPAPDVARRPMPPHGTTVRS